MAYRWLGSLRVLPGLAALAVAALPCRAQGEPPANLEMWAGGQAFPAAWSVYTGASWAPVGGLREDGLRLRAVLGSGGYRGGSLAFADVLIGHHKQLGPVTLKLFGGLTVEEHAPTAPTSSLEGSAIGVKGVAEAWWAVSDKAWASLDLAIALPHLHMAEQADPERVDYSGRVRLGWRLWPALSIGLEGGAGGPLAPTLQTTLHEGAAYAGGFLRYEWESGEVSVSGGISIGEDLPEGHGETFGTVSLLTRF